MTEAVPTGVTIRPETGGDANAITALVRAAFGGDAEARLVAAIRGSMLYLPALSLVAEVDGAVVGHVMISHVFLDVEGAGAGTKAPFPNSGVHHISDGSSGGRQLIASLAPLAVTPERHRHGIGSALVRAVTSAAAAHGEPLVVLEGSPAYYGRFGFEPAANHGLVMALPDWAPPEAAQVLRLPGYEPWLRGRVVYPPAFDAATADH